MAQPLDMSASRAYPVTVEQAFSAILAAPLEHVFSRRYGPIPAVRSTEPATQTWGEVGQVRTVRLAGGGSMHEELTLVEPPNAFGYRLSRVTGPMRQLASHVDGLWRFEPVGTGTRVTWHWTVYPASSLAARLLPAFARIWRGYARQSLERIEQLVLGG